MVQTGHLFAPMPDVIRDDTPSSTGCISTCWLEAPAGATSTSPTTTTVIDYLAEPAELRKHNFTEVIDHYSLAHLNARDCKAKREPCRVVEILHHYGHCEDPRSC
jgi:ATP-dependent Lon protease